MEGVSGCLAGCLDGDRDSHQAIGVLIERGHHPEQVWQDLREQARAAGHTENEQALALLASLKPLDGAGAVFGGDETMRTGDVSPGT
jgi:hypothetical protein